MVYKHKPTRHASEHHMYHNDRTLDLQVQRRQALEISLGSSRAKPLNVTIHFHPYLTACEGHEHEFYPAGGKKEEEEETDGGRADS